MLMPTLADAFGRTLTPKKFGVQLYTTMSIIDKDVTGTLKQIADIGYKEIESALAAPILFFAVISAAVSAA